MICFMLSTIKTWFRGLLKEQDDKEDADSPKFQARDNIPGIHLTFVKFTRKILFVVDKELTFKVFYGAHML